LRRNDCWSVGCISREYQIRLGELRGSPTRIGGGLEVQLSLRHGTFTVPVSINEAITLDFTIDSGASGVTVPADVVLTLIRTGSLAEDDFLGNRAYRLADGGTVPSQTFRIRSSQVGGGILRNVTGRVGPVDGNFLLGQSFLTRFRSWSINNERGVLILE